MFSEFSIAWQNIKIQIPVCISIYFFLDKNSHVTRYFLGFLSTYLTQQRKRMVWRVLGTPAIQEPRYLILSNLSALTVDTTSTTTIGLTNRILMVILITQMLINVKWKYMVSFSLKLYYLQNITITFFFNKLFQCNQS